MDIIRKRLNQNIEENKTLIRNVSLEQSIRQKVKIIFNNAEIKSKRRIFFISDKTDASKINSINNAISRLSAYIKIINMLSQSVRNEQLTYYNENNTLNTFLSNKDEKVSKEITNRVLKETFNELKASLNAIATFSNIPALVIRRDGLFTLMLYTANFENEFFKYNYRGYCCLDEINPKDLSKANLKIYKYYPGSMAKDILKFWKSTNNLEIMYNGFWGDYNDCWEFVKKVNPALYPRSNPSDWNMVD